MKRIKLILPYALAVIIIFVGYFSIEGIKTLIPSHKNTVKIFDRPEQNNLFYMGRNNEIAIYPWDILDESKCVPLDKNVGEKILGYPIINELIFNFDSKAFIPYEDEQEKFNPKILYDEKSGIAFVRDYVYQNIDREKVTVSYAFNKSGILYLHCAEYNQKDLTPNEIKDASIKIDGYIKDKDAFLFGDALSEENDMVEIITQYNPLADFFRRSSDLELHLYPHTIITKISPIVVSHKDELLLIFYYNNTQLVLFYNPRMDFITGFSVK